MEFGDAGTYFAHKFPKVLVCPTGSDLTTADYELKLSIVKRVLLEAFPRAGAWLHAAPDVEKLYDSHYGSLALIWRSLQEHNGDQAAIMAMAPDQSGPKYGTAHLYHSGDGSEVAEGQRLTGECTNVAVHGDPLTGPGGTLPDAHGLIFAQCSSLCERSPACEAITHSLDHHNRCKLWRRVRSVDHGSDRHFKHKSDMMHKIACPSATDTFPIAMTPTALAGTRAQQIAALLPLLSRLFKKREWTAGEAEELYETYHGDMVGIWKKLGIEHFAKASQPLIAVSPGDTHPPVPKLSFEHEL